MPSSRRCSSRRASRSATGPLSQDCCERATGWWDCPRKGPEGTNTIRAKIVVGADGAFSKVREALKIPADLYLYPDGYLIAILESEEPVSESFYYVGHRTILGVFPATGNKVYLFYMIPKRFDGGS